MRGGWESEQQMIQFCMSCRMEKEIGKSLFPAYQKLSQNLVLLIFHTIYVPSCRLERHLLHIGATPTYSRTRDPWDFLVGQFGLGGKILARGFCTFHPLLEYKRKA